MTDESDDLRETYDADLSGVQGLRKDRDAIKRRQKYLRDLKLLLQKRDKRGFMAALRALGIQDGTPKFRAMVEDFDDKASRL